MEQVKDQMDLKLKKAEADGSSKGEPLAFGIDHVQFAWPSSDLPIPRSVQIETPKF